MHGNGHRTPPGQPLRDRPDNELMETRVLALSSGVKVVCVELPIPQPVVGAMRGESVAFFALPQSVFGHFATLFADLGLRQHFVERIYQHAGFIVRDLARADGIVLLNRRRRGLRWAAP
jgi:hypothetical protein